MRHRARALALAALAAAGLSAAAAQEGARLGIINSQSILEKSVEGKRIFAQFQAADKKYADGIARLDEQIKQLQGRLSAQRLTLTPEAAAAIQADIQKKQTERQRSLEDATRGMQELQASVLEQMQREVMPIVEQLRKEKGLAVLFDLAKPGTVYFAPSIDLTDELIRRYDALKAAPPVKK